QEYLQRTFKTVNGVINDGDRSKTIIHACVAHVMCHFRKKIVNKLVIDELREMAMWCLSLLLNTGVWSEMLENWQLICEIFMNYFTTPFPIASYEILSNKIAQLKRKSPSSQQTSLQDKKNDQTQSESDERASYQNRNSEVCIKQNLFL
ncbi:unnamed protein product, partial [Didymodactylos carnosus]